MNKPQTFRVGVARWHAAAAAAVAGSALLGGCGGGTPERDTTAVTTSPGPAAHPDRQAPARTAASTGAGSATLQWAPPLTRADGRPATTPWVGYRVLYGQAPGQYAGSLWVGGTATEATVSGLGRGTWYFAVVAMDTAGLESNPSHEVSKTL